jgi:hypothetical protein
MDIEEILKGWHTLQEPLSKITEVTICYSLLQYELQHKNRQLIKDRIQSRIRALCAKQVKEFYDAGFEAGKTRSD